MMTENNSKENSIFLSIVVPCYNEEAAIPLFLEETEKICSQINVNFEFIFIDDGSKDNTLEVLRKSASDNNKAHYISFSRNFGKEAAMLAGLQAAKGDYVAVMDVDGQDPPSLIPQMLECVVSGEFDCAGARRISREGEPPVRSLFARMFYSLMRKIADVDIVDGARDFRLMNRKYLEAFLALREQNRFSKAIFPWIGFKIKWFEYKNIERKADSTKWSFWKLFLYSLDGIIAFSSKPLAIASVTGVLFCFISFLFIVFIIIRRIVWGDPVSGWASTVCIVLFCSGLQLFATGILGQYMAKTYTEVKQRPHFIVREAK